MYGNVAEELAGKGVITVELGESTERGLSRSIAAEKAAGSAVRMLISVDYSGKGSTICRENVYLGRLQQKRRHNLP